MRKNRTKKRRTRRRRRMKGGFWPFSNSEGGSSWNPMNWFKKKEQPVAGIAEPYSPQSPSDGPAAQSNPDEASDINNTFDAATDVQEGGRRRRRKRKTKKKRGGGCGCASPVVGGRRKKRRRTRKKKKTKRRRRR